MQYCPANSCQHCGAACCVHRQERIYVTNLVVKLYLYRVQLCLPFDILALVLSRMDCDCAVLEVQVLYECDSCVPE